MKRQDLEDLKSLIKAIPEDSPQPVLDVVDEWLNDKDDTEILRQGLKKLKDVTGEEISPESVSNLALLHHSLRIVLNRLEQAHSSPSGEKVGKILETGANRLSSNQIRHYLRPFFDRRPEMLQA